MKPQTPAEGISLVGTQTNESVTFQVECECTDPEHGILNVIEVCIEEEFDDSINLILYADMSAHDENIFKRIKRAFTYIFVGRLTVNRDIILNEQTTINYIACLDKGLKKIRKNKQDRLAK